MNQQPYSSMLGAGDGAPFGGEPLQQAIVTDTCYVNRNEYQRRASTKAGADELVYKDDIEIAKVFNPSVYRVFEHELCLTYVDNLSHQPSINNSFGILTPKGNGGMDNHKRMVYEKAGLSSVKFSSYPNVFSSLNKATTKPVPPVGNEVFPSADAYKTFIESPSLSEDLKKYFPSTYHLFTSHFAFKCVGTAKTNDHVPVVNRWDIPVNCGGRVHPFATELVFAGQVVEWYLLDPKNLTDEYNELITGTGNTHEKIIVGLRENKSYLLDEAKEATDDVKLKKCIDKFMTCRILGKSLKTSNPGERCDLLLSKGPYCL